MENLISDNKWTICECSYERGYGETYFRLTYGPQHKEGGVVIFS